jgi:ABC-type antimicrobial peptide transport system permease subunit
MRAVGFGRRKLGWFVLIENAFLLIVGIGAGCLAATLSILPHALAQSPEVPWLTLAYTLILVYVIGMIASVAAIFAALRIPLLPALKEEG